METIVTKSYQGAQTRLLLPKVKDVAGVIGDNNSTKICFKIPKNYATGWLKYIEFDCYVIRDDTEIKPSYLLDEHDSFIVPYEITESNIGKEVDYCLKLVSEDGEIVEKSELATLYFRDSCNGTNTEPEPYTDIVTLLYNNAFCNVSYSDPTDGAEEPQLTFTPLNPNGEPESVSLNIPYLDAQGHIPPRFIDKEIVVEIFKISTPDELTTLVDAQIPDMALISEGDSSEPYYMDLYMLVGSDPTDIDKWYLIHTSNPVFTSIQTTDLTATNGDINELSSENIVADSITATSIEGTFSGDLTGDVTGNLSGNATTATTADNYNTTQGGIKDALDGKVDKLSASPAGSGFVKIDVNAQGQVINHSAMVEADIPTLSIAKTDGLQTALDGKAPVNHASDATTYGVGSTSQYGHVKVDNSMSDTSTNPVQNSVIRGFVNSSIATSTANFIGTFDAVNDLGFQQSDVDSWGNEPTAQQESDIATAIKSKLQALSIVPTNNDYLFVAINRSTTLDIDSYWRFKYTEAVTPAIWKFEYPLNNSSYTQAQWDTINSLITNTTSNPHVGVDVKDINAHLGNSKIHVPASSDDTNTKVLANTKDGAPTWQTVSASNPTLAWGQESTIGTIAGQTFKVTMPVNPDTDTKVTQGYATNTTDLRPVILSYAKTTDAGTGNVTNIVYRNNSIYANPGLGYLYATKVYSNGSEVVNLADSQEITGKKTYSAEAVFNGVVIVGTSGTVSIDNNTTSTLRFRKVNGELLGYVRVDSSTKKMTVRSVGGVNLDGAGSALTVEDNPAADSNDKSIATTSWVTTALGSYVTLGTEQTISAPKTFSNNVSFSGNITQSRGYPRYIMKDSTNVIGTTNGGDMWLLFEDKNGEVIGRVSNQVVSPSGGVEHTSQSTLQAVSKNGSTGVFSGVSAYATPTGITYSTASWRGADNYASMGTNEIITKGALQASSDVVHRSGNESIAGIKTFTNYGVGLIRQTITVRSPTDAEITAGTVWFQIYTHINTSTACKMRVRAYSRHDSFEFVVGMGGSGSGGSVTSGGFIHRTNSSRRVVFANDGTNVKMYVNGINSAGGYVLTVEQLASDGYAGTSDINSFPLTYNDTPIAYPTATGGFSNIVELTDLTVSTGYSQTIGGSKTFTSTPIINMSLPQLYLKHTTDDYTVATTAVDTRYFIGYQDKNGQDVFHLSEYVYNGGRAMSISQNNKVNGTTVTSGISLTTPATGNGYVTVSYRPYASAGNSDVLVKGHVADMMAANVGNGQISLTSSRGTAIDSFTVNQSSGKSIVLPAASTQYQNVSVTFSAQSPADFSDYPYMASYSVTGLTADMYATVTFSEAQVSSGQYAPFCQTVAGAVRLYAKSGVGAQTIPTISVGMDDSSAQQSMSNFVTLTGDQSIGNIKSFTSELRRVVSPGSTQFSYNVMRGYDTNNVRLWEICSTSRPDGTTRLYVNARQANASFKEVVLSDGQHTSYSSSNTNDVVTIGSLQASTDVVHRTGNESVAGQKSFTSYCTFLNYRANNGIYDYISTSTDTYLYRAILKVTPNHRATLLVTDTRNKKTELDYVDYTTSGITVSRNAIVGTTTYKYSIRSNETGEYLVITTPYHQAPQIVMLAYSDLYGMNTYQPLLDYDASNYTIVYSES